MKYHIIPQPVKASIGAENVFNLSNLCEIEADEGSKKAVGSLLKCLRDTFSLELIGTGREKIVLLVDSNMTKAESYILSVEKDTVTVKGSDESGVFYGVQTLRQLLMQGELSLPKVFIEDYPRFSYRGFMLDCGRYFYTKEAVFAFLEMMAFHKLNRFHWHLSDDQGFRAQLEDNLLLTEIGSYRSHTNFGKIPHQGYYTKADMKEIVQYAHNLCIKVIPEIDTPGHTVSMIAAYPSLSCFERELSVATHSGVKHDVLCVGKESTFDFMFSVFDELLEVFTDGTVHIGGDEVPTTRWEICPHCRERANQLGLKSIGELHTYYLDRIGEYLKSKGVNVIMWNDSVKDYMTDSSISWQLWNSEMSSEDVAREINKGRSFIISDSRAYYLDLPYMQVNLKKAYDFEPTYEGITAENESKILGVEACLWSEYVPTMKKAGYCTFPRIGAMSESAWTPKENKSFDAFTEKLDAYYMMLDFMGFDYANKKQAMPSFIRGAGYFLYWERRKLHWQGLHNLIDNAYVKRKYGGE